MKNRLKTISKMQNGMKMKLPKQRIEETMPKQKNTCKPHSLTTQKEKTICDQQDNARNKDC